MDDRWRSPPLPAPKRRPHQNRALLLLTFYSRPRTQSTISLLHQLCYLFDDRTCATNVTAIIAFETPLVNAYPNTAALPATDESSILSLITF